MVDQPVIGSMETSEVHQKDITLSDMPVPFTKLILLLALV